MFVLEDRVCSITLFVQTVQHYPPSVYQVFTTWDTKTQIYATSLEVAVNCSCYYNSIFV